MITTIFRFDSRVLFLSRLDLGILLHLVKTSIKRLLCLIAPEEIMQGGFEVLAHASSWMPKPLTLCKRHPPPLSTKNVKFGTAFRASSSSKASLDYQDCHGYARPLRLLPATEANVCTESSLEDMSTAMMRVAESRSVYIIKLHTSSAYGSSLSDLNAGIMLCLIDENGNSILQRTSATPVIYSPAKETSLQDLLCFQRGSVNDFAFEGPKLGRIEAIWIGLESGSWRLGGVSLTVINGCQPQSDNAEKVENKVNHNSALKYDFEAEDITFGGREDMSMVELKPCHITELSGIDVLALLNMDSRSSSLMDQEIYNKESMREYADLKSCLLVYNSILILAGTSISAISIGEEAALAFLVGGAGGFLYLLLLQKSVDGLPAPALTSMGAEDQNFNQVLRRVKSPILTLALAFGMAVLVLKYGSRATPVQLTAKEILAGMTGFISCKIAVVLAAFYPLPIKLKENKW